MQLSVFFIFALCAYGAVLIRAEDSAECPWHRTDIIFFVDQKNSTGSPVLEQTVKPFISTFITTLKDQLATEKNHNVRVAVVTFGGQMVVHHCLSADQSKDTLISKVKSIKYAPGPMSFSTAFEKCDKANCFKPGNKDYKTDKTIVFFLTDGSADEVDAAKEVAKVFKDRNFATYGIGTGIEGRETELLKTVASEPITEHLFNIRDRCKYDNLVKKILKYVRKDQCVAVATEAPTTVETTTTTAVPTSAPTTNDVTELQVPEKLLIAADICFIIDASFSLSKDQFRQEKEFAVDLMQYIPMGEFGARFATLTFAYRVKIHYSFDDATTPASVFQQTRDIPFNAEGATFTDKAIMWARTKVFSGDEFKPRHKAVKAAKIAIVITDGAPSRMSLLKTESDLAREDGITILGVGIGPGFAKNKDLLMPMVGGKAENIFIAKEFNELNDKIVEVMERLRDSA